MYGDITSIDHLIDTGNYSSQLKEINEFLTKITNEIKIDTVIGKDRKGIWTVKDYSIDNLGFTANILASEGTIEEKRVRGLSVLIFDDSIHTGKTVIKIIDDIKKFKPKSIVVACLIANEDGINNIKSKHPGIDVKTCQPVFPVYQLQSEKFVKWLMTYLSGIRTKVNPDFNSLVLVTNGRNLRGIANVVIDLIKDLYPVTDYYYNNSLADTRQSLSISFILDENHKGMLPPPYDTICEPDFAKMRVFLRENGDSTEIVITPMICPIIRYSDCKIRHTHPTKCLSKLLGKKTNNTLCKLCVPFMLNNEIIIKNIQNFIEKMGKKGFPIIRQEFEALHFKRYSG